MTRLWWIAALAVGCGDTANATIDAAVDTTPAADAIPDATLDGPPLCPAPTLFSTAQQPELLVANDPGSTMGIFDPSIVYPVGASAGALAYSSVPDQETIRTHIAVSADHGLSWIFVAEANTPSPAAIDSSDPGECPTGTCTGNLISEVTSLIFDADDPNPQTRWKLFAHRYLVGAGVALHYRLGTIALQTAAQPQGPWSAPIKLIGWTDPHSTYSSTGVVANASTFPRTADCLALTEPSALWLPGTIDLAVGCVYLAGGVPQIRIELLRSTTHAASWASVSTLLLPEDSGCLASGASINAAELFTYAGHEYIAATPSDASGYHGCLVYPIDDIPSGHVARLGTRAIVTRTIAPFPTTFSGACGFSENAGGFAIDVGVLGDRRTFRIYRTGITTP